MEEEICEELSQLLPLLPRPAGCGRCPLSVLLPGMASFGRSCGERKRLVRVQAASQRLDSNPTAEQRADRLGRTSGGMWQKGGRMADGRACTAGGADEQAEWIRSSRVGRVCWGEPLCVLAACGVCSHHSPCPVRCELFVCALAACCGVAELLVSFVGVLCSVGEVRHTEQAGRQAGRQAV